MKKKPKKTKKPSDENSCVYKVKVRTGNANYAGTDANVYITICGKRSNLDRKRLFNKYDSVRLEGVVKYRFERNSTNIFKLTGPDIGEINNIIIEVSFKISKEYLNTMKLTLYTLKHDGKELRQSWLLLDVMVSHVKLKRSWLFECNDWLSNNYGLFKTIVRLEPTKTIEKYLHTDYEVVTVTGDKLGAGTDANV